MLPTEKMMYASENMPRPGRPKEMYLAMGSVRKDRYLVCSVRPTGGSHW
jgi:hypothetical protein